MDNILSCCSWDILHNFPKRTPNNNRLCVQTPRTVRGPIKPVRQWLARPITQQSGLLGRVCVPAESRCKFSDSIEISRFLFSKFFFFFFNPE